MYYPLIWCKWGGYYGNLYLLSLLVSNEYCEECGINVIFYYVGLGLVLTNNNLVANIR